MSLADTTPDFQLRHTVRCLERDRADAVELLKQVLPRICELNKWTPQTAELVDRITTYVESHK